MTRICFVKLSLLIGLIGGSFTAQADSRELLNQYVRQFTNSIWSPFQLRLSQLPLTYVSEITDLERGFAISYFSYEGVPRCGNPAGVKNLVARVVYEAIHESKEYIQERISYYGCRERDLFSELRTREGEDLELMEPKDVIFGERKFVLEENEDSLHIQMQLIGQPGEVFFHSIVEKKEDQFSARIFSFNYNLITLQTYRDDELKEDRLALQVKHGYNIGLRFHGERISSNWRDSHVVGFEVRKSGRNTKSFVKSAMSDPKLVSENAFQMEMNGWVNALIKYSAGSVIDRILSANLLPPTEARSVAPSANRAIIDEFQLNLTRLRLGTEPEALEQFFLEYISGLEDGSIIIQGRESQ